MPPIKLKKVVSVSSEDSNHQAENLLDYGFRTKWKCKSASDKEISVVIELEKPSKILSVDICNENSAFIEILVGRSESPADFEVLLKKSTLMTAEDAKTGKGVNNNKYFTSDALCTKIRDERWDLVKLVCSQPYLSTQYGLSFVVFSD
ncbi:DNA repair protein XRCC1-like [Cimex lectularius]|uniref:DNA-repair protein Xrcc1 N-terminal domain-containing protein n=1 Tax=Cimex lectularius TaxID=79782 RepID=A0A8I6S135_CIMLE|nr:DNA repair protein XRCC1-like [Cimex lectularius]